MDEYRATVALNEELYEPPGKCVSPMGSDASTLQCAGALDIVCASGRLAELRTSSWVRARGGEPAADFQPHNPG